MVGKVDENRGAPARQQWNWRLSLTSASVTHPSLETRSFVFFVSVLSVLCGAIIRLAIHYEAPLPSSKPVLFLALGALQDITVFSLAASIALIGSRWPRAEEPLTVAFGTFALAVNALLILRSGAVIFFGSAIQADDLRRGVPLLLIRQSLAGLPGLILGALLLLLITLMALSWWGARRSRQRWMARPIYLGVFFVAAVLIFFSKSLAQGSFDENSFLSVFARGADPADSAAQARSAIPRPELSELTVRNLAAQQPPRHYLDFEYPLAYQPDDPPAPVPRAVKPNIVLLVVESLRAEEVGCYGADPPGLTPNIDAIARDGIRVDPAFSSGTYTASGELGLWYGLPPLPGEILLASRPDVILTGLPEILGAAGWKRFLWIHGGDYNFYGRDRFYPRRGIQTVDGHAFPPTDPRTVWGFSDRALVRNAIKALSSLPEPFASMVLTVSNHHPFELPPDADPRVALPPHKPAEVGLFPGSDHVLSNRAPSLAQTVHYSDEAIGDFFRAARQQPWFAHTIFVITGDHGSVVAPYSRPVNNTHTLLELRHRVPLIIYSPLLKGGQTIAGPASHFDIMPTLLAAAGVTLPRPGIGSNLLDPRLSKDRIITMWNAHERTLTLASGPWSYHARYEGTGPLEQQEPIETLVNVASDKTGNVNYVSKPPPVLRRFRSAARIYVTVYPWLVVSGRSGVPPITGSQ